MRICLSTSLTMRYGMVPRATWCQMLWTLIPCNSNVSSYTCLHIYTRYIYTLSTLMYIYSVPTHHAGRGLLSNCAVLSVGRWWRLGWTHLGGVTTHADTILVLVTIHYTPGKDHIMTSWHAHCTLHISIFLYFYCKHSLTRASENNFFKNLHSSSY